MDTPEALMRNLDTEFDQALVEMKPYVLRLPHKSERQRCALWIKKFCDPPATGITARKNRNMYTQLMLHMVKKGLLEGPFTQQPESGPLPTLPAYMSIYFDNAKTQSAHAGTIAQSEAIPDWVAGELVGGASALGLAVSDPLATSAGRLNEAKDKFSTAVLSSPRRVQTTIGWTRERQHPSGHESHSFMPGGVREPIFNGRPVRTTLFSENEEEETTNGEDVHHSNTQNETDDWRRTSRPGTSGLTLSTGSNDPSMIRMHERELDLKVKMMEAKFQEDKLKLQQRHDSNVQKILDRKNAEIEDLKAHYRNKGKDQEETLARQEKKVQSLLKEMSHLKETKDAQIAELKKLTEETNLCKQNEFEKKMHDAVATFEQEKFEMQKQHTKAIQELLDDTNKRLTKMEEEYNQQSQATTLVIQELEAHVQQLAEEAEAMTSAKTLLEKEKTELESSLEAVQSELLDYQSKCSIAEKEQRRESEDHQLEVKSIRNKLEAQIEFLKQEQQLSSVKAADKISDLEHHVAQLKQSLENTEIQRQRQVRELEQQQGQDKLHLEHLHDKKVHGLQKELDQIEQESGKKIRKLEQTIRDKDDELSRQAEQHKQQLQQHEQAFAQFKDQVQHNSGKMFEDMKQQMEKVEADLNRSKQLREKQLCEFEKQQEEEKSRVNQQIQELKMTYEQEKENLLRDIQAEREARQSQHQQEMSKVTEPLRVELTEFQSQAKEQQDRDTKTIQELEQQVHSLREEVVQANQLRKQQLVELGLLREEEKQKQMRDHEGEVQKLKSQMEQQRLDLEKAHSSDMEQMLDKTNSRLREIEKEYTVRGTKSIETMNDLQKTNQQLRDDLSRQRDQSKQELAEVKAQADEEKKNLKQQHSTSVMALQQECEGHKVKARTLDRKLAQQEQDSEEKINQLRMQYEDKMKGLMPATVRQELEDTISSLKSQVTSLQQRAAILQEELEVRQKYPVSNVGSSLGNSLSSSTPIKANT